MGEDPNIDAPADRKTAGSEGQAVPHNPPVAACPSPSLAEWLEPAIREVLANHTYDYGDCRTIDGGYCVTYIPSGPPWEEHVAPLIAQRIETALTERTNALANSVINDWIDPDVDDDNDDGI